MYTLYAFVSNILNILRSYVGLILPIFSNAADFRNWPQWVRIGVGLLLLGGLCYGAYWLQEVTRFAPNFLTHLPTRLQPFWLVILVLLFVAFSWLAFLFWKLLAEEDEAAEFPDIQLAWSEAVKRLAASGMSVGDAPLFLVVGAPAAGMDSFILAGGAKDIVRAPSRSDSPLRIYAWDKAIFVTAADCSSWGALCREISGQGEAAWAGPAEGGGDPNKTIGVGGFMGGMDPIARAEMDDLFQKAKVRDLTPAEQSRLNELANEMTTTAKNTKKKVAMSDDTVNRGNRRLRYLCKLIRQDRRPWCPLNGLVVLIPWDAAENDDTVRLSSNVLLRDLAGVRETVEMRYPTFAVVCDLESARGFTEFRNGFPEDMRRNRIGQGLPLLPDVDDDKINVLIALATKWIGLSVLPTWILRFLRLNPPKDSSLGFMEDLTPNRNLYHLMRSVFDRGPRLAQILSRGLPPIGGTNDPYARFPYYHGCYITGTGKDGQNQAFVPGVFEKVLAAQNAVSWTPAAEAADQRLRKLTLFGYLGLLLASVLAGVLIWLNWNAKM